ncbi:hypothetical protein SBBP1_730009 [Burkholderiales bacterium]|nr:hypothetical protein SBBP1_730009 [Burkholderiales bacterium]
MVDKIRTLDSESLLATVRGLTDEASEFSYRPVRPLTAYRPFWAKRFGPAKFLPMSRAEMDALGWDSCDIVIVSGDAYVDHPSFGMALIGRVLEAQGFRVGIIAQPDWQSAEPFKALGRPNLFFGVTAGNMDSMINRYTADRKIRSDDAYTPGGIAGKRPDRCALVYAQRCREAYGDVPLVMGGIEGSLRRIAHYDYWQDKVRRSMVVDSKCDLLVYGSAERAIVEIAHRLAARVRRARHGLRAAPESAGLVRDRFELDRRARCGGLGSRSLPQSLPDDDRARRTAIIALRSGAVRGHCRVSGQRLTAGRLAAAYRARGQWRPPAARAPARSHRDPLAVVRTGACRSRAVCARKPGAAPGDQPGQCARVGPGARRRADGARRLAQSAADSIDDGGDGCRVRSAVRACAPSELRRHRRAEQDSRVGDDSLQRQHHARLLWRLHLLFHHRARGTHHSEPQRGIDPSRNRDDPRPGRRLYRCDLRSWRTDRQHVSDRLQVGADRGRVPKALLRVSEDLPELGDRPWSAHPPVPPRARATRREESVDRLWSALRPGAGIARVHPRIGEIPRRRLSQDRAGTYRARSLAHDDEARHWRVRPLQATVRQVQRRGRQEAILGSVLHRCTPRHHGRGHDASGALAQAQRISRRPGADVLPRPHGNGHGDVPQRQESAGQGDPRQRRRRHRAGGAPAAAAQGVLALSRSQELAAAARRAQGHGARGSHR